MSDALANGDRVEIRGLCSIFVKEYGAYTRAQSQNRREGKNQTEEVAIFQGGQGIEGKSRSLNR
jgi:integration host factor subunit beta